MRKANVFVNNCLAGIFFENDDNTYSFEYLEDYQADPISLTMPIDQKIYRFEEFPAFFDGLLPEGVQLEALLKQAKLNRTDYFGQLITVGADMVGAVTVEECH
jgi:serine/threonine-protein kinase HipA